MTEAPDPDTGAAHETDLVEACRDAIGDDLRSIVYFTPDSHGQLYLRNDLEADADLSLFVDNERLGFRSHDTYAGSELGEYAATVRVFGGGYLLRVIEGGRGVFVTTDEVGTDGLRAVAAAIRGVLAE